MTKIPLLSSAFQNIQCHPRRTLRRARRLLAGLGSAATTLCLLLMLTFVIGRLMPVDPVIAVVGADADGATYAKVARELGVDRPITEQFMMFISRMAHGDFGLTLMTGRPVFQDIARVFPATLELATVTIILGACIGVPLGIYAAVNRGRLSDHATRLISLMGNSVPIFWTGLIGLIVFYAHLGWAGGSGRLDPANFGIVPDVTGLMLIDATLAGDWDVLLDSIRHIALPALVLAYSSVAYISRMTRSFMLDQLRQEYVLAARAKGVPQRDVVWHHAFRNIRVQLVTMLALSYGSLLEGAVVIEAVFAWPGFGQYMVNALMVGDMNAIVACTLVIGCIFICLNLICDLLYRVFDPRTR